MTFKDLTEDKQSVFLAGVQRALANRASTEGYRPSDGQILDGERLVHIARMQHWVAMHLEALLLHRSQRYGDVEFEAALRNYADRIGFSDELDERLEAAARWHW